MELSWAGQAVFASIAAQQEEARKAQQAEEEVRKAKEEEARKAQQAEEEARKSKEEQEKAAKDAGLEKRLGDMLKEIKKKRGEKRSKEEMEGEKDERERAMDEKGKEEEKKRGPIPAFQPQHRKDSMQKPTKQNREKGRWARDARDARRSTRYRKELHGPNRGLQWGLLRLQPSWACMRPRVYIHVN